jgi:hypothetical protein
MTITDEELAARPAPITLDYVEELRGAMRRTQIRGSTPQALAQMAASVRAPHKVDALPDDQKLYATPEAFALAARLKAGSA